MDIKTFIFRLIILFSTFSIIGCQSADKKFFPYQFDTEKYQKLSGTKKVILVPTQFFDPGITDDNKKYRSLDLAIKSYLEEQGFEVFTSAQAKDIWNKHLQQATGVFDQKTGRTVPSRVENVIKKTITNLREISGFSVLIIPNVQYRPIKLSKKSLNKAVWNGVSRSVNASHESARMKWNHQIAMSLDITIITEDSLNPLFRGKGGIDFQTKNVAKGNAYSRNAKPFDETPKEYISEAIEIAFYPFINSPLVEKTMPDSYYKMLYRKIGFFMKYPESAIEQTIKDRVVVQFKILPSGNAVDIKVVKPSQYEIFNTQAVNSIKAASPFPPPPARYFKEGMTIVIPLDFQPNP